LQRPRKNRRGTDGCAESVFPKPDYRLMHKDFTRDLLASDIHIR